jgi:hypothetical protein
MLTPALTGYAMSNIYYRSKVTGDFMSTSPQHLTETVIGTVSVAGS